jgi:hypothetical protein
VIVSLLYQLTRRLLSVPAVLLRHDTSKDADLLVLRHENAVLRRQITGQVRYESADRFWFAALSSLLPRRRWYEIFPVQPATILAWHRKFIARNGITARADAPPDDHPPTRRSRNSCFTWPTKTHDGDTEGFRCRLPGRRDHFGAGFARSTPFVTDGTT